ncbi:hypothetical protein VP01_1386g2 [Puccinia sorghi]|uniref:DDE Tnp4 domain-containing protein n=1 Tax=Puccinia sorghi TaxID=27349 RepID=A0A0L6VLF3_9BASI|nr:hypothetical protein VP01_1386g2 [Puccinia sorghi]
MTPVEEELPQCEESYSLARWSKGPVDSKLHLHCQKAKNTIKNYSKAVYNCRLEHNGNSGDFSVTVHARNIGILRTWSPATLGDIGDVVHVNRLEPGAALPVDVRVLEGKVLLRGTARVVFQSGRPVHGNGLVNSAGTEAGMVKITHSEGQPVSIECLDEWDTAGKAGFKIWQLILYYLHHQILSRRARRSEPLATNNTSPERLQNDCLGAIDAAAGLRLQTPKELFNLRHSSLRNVVEGLFGCLKGKFKILTTPCEHNIHRQVFSFVGYFSVSSVGFRPGSNAFLPDA